MEEVLARHRKEARDLQNRITQKKKQASKKTRKGVNDECDRLEAELKQTQQAEIAALESGDSEINEETGQIPSDRLQDLQLSEDEEVTHHGELSAGAKQPTSGSIAAELSAQQTVPSAKDERAKKGSRQKARLARRAAEQDEIIRQAKEEAQNLPDMKQQERQRMLDAMKQYGLQEKEIRADGHCLYSAIADQLQQLDVPLDATPGHEPNVTYKTVRAKAADYIEQHEDDFVPFLEESLPDYLHKVRDTGEWGGQLELMALAKTYGVNINVLQDFGRVENIQSDSGDASKTIWLGYYKHGFGLGEHYNSLRKASAK